MTERGVRTRDQINKSASRAILPRFTIGCTGELAAASLMKDLGRVSQLGRSVMSIQAPDTSRRPLTHQTSFFWLETRSAAWILLVEDAIELIVLVE